MSDEIALLDATAQAELIRSGELTPLELVDRAIARIERLNPQLNAVIIPLFEKARAQARNGVGDGPFRGVPMLLKDLLAYTEGDPHHMGTRPLRDAGFVAPHDAYLAQKFKAAGCLNLGFSLESGNREILEMMDKKIEPEYFYDQIAILKEAGITCSTSVVFGYPIETPETIKQTFAQCLEAGVYPSIGFLLPLPYTGMYKYAKEHGFIPDDDKFLDSITERQDLCLNMTKMSNEEVMGLIKTGAADLNRMLELGLAEDRLIKTGGYRNHTKATARGAKPLLDPNNLKRNENDVSFNYSQATFSNEQLAGERDDKESGKRKVIALVPSKG